MRQLVLALLPAALAACGGTEAPRNEVPPAPAQQAAAKPAATPVAPAVQLTEANGTWSQTSGSTPRVTFTSTEGEDLFSVACLPANTETGAPMLEIQTVTPANAPAERIDIFTSSSNAAVVANPAAEPGRVLGYAETGGTVHYALARGAGEIKIVSGTRATTFQTNPMMKQLIDACHPPYVHEAKDKKAAADTGAGEEAADDTETQAPDEPLSGT